MEFSGPSKETNHKCSNYWVSVVILFEGKEARHVKMLTGKENNSTDQGSKRRQNA
jgi:hypothetical protein